MDPRKSSRDKSRSDRGRNFGGGGRSGGGRFESYSEDREMHSATCAECGSQCEVPFKPSGDRPVYCRDCYRKRKPRF